MLTKVLYRFDAYSIDPEERKLRHGQTLIPLAPKVFQTLLVLVENQDRVLSKDELLNAIWPEYVVEEANLTQNISLLRKALSEAVLGKKYIATFSGRGYRFLEPVTFDHGVTGPEPSPEQSLSKVEPDHTAARHDAIKSAAAPPFGWTIPTVVIAAACLLGAIAGWKYHATNPPRESALSQPALRTLVRTFGAQYQPAWSPDERSLAFVYSGPSSPRPAIYIQSAEDSHPHPITSGDGEYSSPAWSPDGSRLAFIHTGPGLAEIVVADLASHTLKSLARIFPHRYGLICRQLDWSPDGQLLLVADKQEDLDPFSLYVVYVTTGEKARLTYPSMNVIGDVAPRFSPDGTQVAFIRIKYQYEYDIFTITMTASEARAVTNHSYPIGDVAWENTHSLIFSAKRGSEFRFWRKELNGVGNESELATAVATDQPPQFTISHRMGAIAFAAYRPNLNIWQLSLSSRNAAVSPWKLVVGSPGEDTFPAYSPDNTKISFRSDRSGAGRLWVSQADGSGAFPLASAPLEPGYSSWSPDGRSIVFSVLGPTGIYSSSVEKVSRLQHVSADPLGHPSYSVDGKSIFVQSNMYIYRLSADGRKRELLSDRGGYPIVQSRDGRYLYFARGRMDGRISRIDLSARTQATVLNSLLPGYWGCWALASKGIYFLTEQAGQPWIAFHDLSTGGNRMVIEYPGDLPPVGTGTFSLSKDERQLLLVRSDPAAAAIQAFTLADSGDRR